MKKVVFFSLLLLLAGCGNKDSLKTNSPSSTNNQEVVDNTSKGVENEGSTSPELTNNQPTTMNRPNNAGQAEDLVSKYTQAVIKTNQGDIKIKFYNQESPITVNNFLNLAKSGFYDGVRFHRTIKNFMIQGGDPNSKDDDWSNDGIGGPSYKFDDEFNDHKIVKGSLAMANAGKNTNGSQFFIVTADELPYLDGVHTNFGYVIEGMEVVSKIENVKTNKNDHPEDDMTIESIELLP